MNGLDASLWEDPLAYMGRHQVHNSPPYSGHLSGSHIYELTAAGNVLARELHTSLTGVLNAMLPICFYLLVGSLIHVQSLMLTGETGGRCASCPEQHICSYGRAVPWAAAPLHPSAGTLTPIPGPSA